MCTECAESFCVCVCELRAYKKNGLVLPVNWVLYPVRKSVQSSISFYRIITMNSTNKLDKDITLVQFGLRLHNSEHFHIISSYRYVFHQLHINIQIDPDLEKFSEKKRKKKLRFVEMF